MYQEQDILQYIEQCMMTQKPLKQTSRLFSTLRLSSIVLALILAIYADQTHTNIGFYLAGVLILFFLVLVVRHSEIKRQLQRLDAKIFVAQKLKRRINGEWKREGSTSQCPKEDVLSYDLDLLGPSSLYAYCDMCATPYGKRRLETLLLGKDDNIQQVKQRQAAIQELLHHQDFLWEYESAGVLFAQDAMKLQDTTFDDLIVYGTKGSQTLTKAIRYGSMCMAFLTILTLILAVFQIIPYGYSAVLMLANLIISLIISSHTSDALSNSKNLYRIIKDYDILFACMKNVQFQDPYLISLQETMKQGKNGLDQLNKVMDMLALRHNILSYLILAALMQIDVPCVFILETWRRAYGKETKQWFQAAGEMEALISLSVIGQVLPYTCFPTLLDQKEPYLHIQDGLHPLLSQKKAVANSVELTNGSVIITGSNMSGKTTFLRMLGVNMMLARAGTCVCANTMHCTLMGVYTSMRVKDDVNEGISTFYAELLRIRHMMEASKQKQNMLVLIDEIFKGTNSADRIMCAKTAITKLHLPWIITLVSTHDFELCALSEDPMISAINYHFEEYYEQDDIYFDYRLKEGRSTSTNALQLMRLAGISDA